MATEESRPGYYLDRHGQWQKERRVNPDRRKAKHAYDHDRRKMFRRKADRELYATDHKRMIRDALDEFAAEHAHQNTSAESET